MHDTLPQCLLAGAGVTTAAGAVAEEWQYFSKETGTACSQVPKATLSLVKQNAFFDLKFIL